MINFSYFKDRVRGLIHSDNKYDVFENESEMDFISPDDSDLTSLFKGGFSEVDDGKITTWQAGWNITNAIQVTQFTCTIARKESVSLVRGAIRLVCMLCVRDESHGALG